MSLVIALTHKHARGDVYLAVDEQTGENIRDSVWVKRRMRGGHPCRLRAS